MQDVTTLPVLMFIFEWEWIKSGKNQECSRLGYPQVRQRALL